MIRGISFKTPISNTKLLRIIFKEQNAEKYEWNIINYQAWKNEKGDLLFNNDIYSGKQLHKIISESSGLIMILAMFGFIGKISNIEVYDDFLKSDCELSVLIVDSNFVEVYCKDINKLVQIKENVQKEGFSQIEDITDENDSRESFVLF